MRGGEVEKAWGWGIGGWGVYVLAGVLFGTREKKRRGGAKGRSILRAVSSNEP